MFQALPPFIGVMATASLLCFVIAGVLVLLSMHLLDASFQRASKSSHVLYFGTLLFAVGFLLSFILVCYLAVSWFAPITH